MKKIIVPFLLLILCFLSQIANAREHVLDGNWCNISETFQVILFNREKQGGQNLFDSFFSSLEEAKKVALKEYQSGLSGSWARQNSETITLFLVDPIKGDRRVGKIVVLSTPVCKWKDRKDLPKQK